MGNLAEIEAAIKQLPANDIRQLAAWLEEYLEQIWDNQIEADLISGKLDTIIAKAEADINEPSLNLATLIERRFAEFGDFELENCRKL